MIEKIGQRLKSDCLVDLMNRKKLPCDMQILPVSIFCMDDIDWQIVESLQADGRMSFRHLAELVSLSPAATTARVHALEQRGVIVGYGALIDPEAIGRSVRGIIRLTGSAITTRSMNQAEQLATRHPAVRRFHQVLGDCDAILYVEASDLAELDDLVTQLGDHGQTTTTLVVSSTVMDKPFANPSQA